LGQLITNYQTTKLPITNYQSSPHLKYPNLLIGRTDRQPLPIRRKGNAINGIGADWQLGRPFPTGRFIQIYPAFERNGRLPFIR
jgi:hypothetical protein